MSSADELLSTLTFFRQQTIGKEGIDPVHLDRLRQIGTIVRTALDNAKVQQQAEGGEGIFVLVETMNGLLSRVDALDAEATELRAQAEASRLYAVLEEHLSMTDPRAVVSKVLELDQFARTMQQVADGDAALPSVKQALAQLGQSTITDIPSPITINGVLLEPKNWVQQHYNKGQVVEVRRDGLVMVRWISPEVPFHDMPPAVVDARTVVQIDEPKLTRELAALYSGLTPTRLYQLNDRGVWGGSKRNPFYATPTELDFWLNSDKAVNGWDKVA